jgi:hypothetical protein
MNGTVYGNSATQPNAAMRQQYVLVSEETIATIPTS